MSDEKKVRKVTASHTTAEGTWKKTWTTPVQSPSVKIRTDAGTEYTDRQYKDLCRRLRVMYRQAADDLMQKQFEWKHAHEKRVNRYRQEVDAGFLTEEDFQAWMRGQLFQEEAWALKRGQLAREMVNIDEQAMRMINDGKLDVFAENANYMGFKIDTDTNAGASFGLYNAQTVIRLVRDQPDMLPMPRVDKKKDYAWYNEIITNAVTQGILQGEDLDGITLRIAQDTGDKALSAMRRNARTAYTGAQNAGRVEAMRQARDDLGIDVQKQWMATLDSKTRDAHAALDGKTANVDDAFDSMLGPIHYPGEASAAPGNVYNCRCTLVPYYPKYASKIRRIDAETGEDAGEVTYEEWKRAKAAKPAIVASLTQSIVPETQMSKTSENKEISPLQSLENDDKIKKEEIRWPIDNPKAVPGANEALILKNKLPGYLLNIDHKDGGPKAKLLKSISGYTPENWQELAKEMQDGLKTGEYIKTKQTEFGMRYDVPIRIRGKKNKSMVMITVWQIDKGTNVARYITSTFDTRTIREEKQ